MSESTNFSDREIRFIQISLVAIFVVGIVWLVVTLIPSLSISPASSPPPLGAVARLGKGTIEQLVASPDGRAIAVRTSIGLFVYRADDLHSLWQETELEILQIGFSPDGRTLWGMTVDRLLNWDTTSGVQRLQFDQIWRETGGSLWLEGPHTWAVWWDSGVPHTLAAPAPCGYQNELFLEPITLMCIDFIDLATGSLVEQLPTVIQLRSKEDPQPSQPVSLYLGSNHITNEFYIAVLDRLWFWDVERQQLSAAVPLPGSLVTQPAFSPEGVEALLLISPSVYVFNRSQSTVEELQTFSNRILSFEYTLDGRRILIGTAEGELIELGRVSHWIIDRHDVGAAVIEIATAQDVDIVLLDEGEGMLLQWRLSSGMRESAIDGFLPPSIEVAWSPQADQLATVSRLSTLERDDPRQLTLWGVNANPIGQRIFGERIIDVAWSPDGETIAVGTWSGGGNVQWLDAASLQVQRQFSLQGDGLCGVAWSVDGRMAVATTEMRLLTFEAGSSSPVQELDAKDLWVPPGAACRGLTWSPDGSIIAMEVANGSPLFWESADGSPIDSLNPDPLDNQAFTASIGWDEDGRPLLAGFNTPAGGGGLEQRVSGIAQPTSLWIEVQQGRFEIGMPDIPADVAFSPDGQRLAIAYQDTVEIIEWDSSLNIDRRALQGHRDEVLGLAWSWEGEYLASYSLDGSVIIWDIDN